MIKYVPERLNSLIARCLSKDAHLAVQEISRDGLWEYVASHACESQVGGALITALGARGLQIPSSAAMQLEAYKEHLVAANAYNRSRTEPVFAALQAENVPFMLLKGAALNATLYDQPGLRAMVDIDVLIRPDDVKKVDHVLITRCNCSRGEELVRDDFYPRYYYEREYFTPNRPSVKLDVHVRPFRPLRYSRTVPDDAIWDNPRQASFGNLLVNVPSPENMLIHLAVHAACHGLADLKWLYDLKQLLDCFGDKIDMENVADKCRRWKVALPVRRALEKISIVFGSPTPILTKAIRDTTRPAGFLERLTLCTSPKAADSPVLYTLSEALCAPGLWFRLGYLKAVWFPSPTHMSQFYPRRHRGWLLIAHLLRLLRGITRPVIQCGILERV